MIATFTLHEGNVLKIIEQHVRDAHHFPEELFEVEVNRDDEGVWRVFVSKRSSGQ